MLKTVLVTGGAGYIGSQTCKALKAAGFLPVVFDNLIYGHRENVRWGPLVEADLADAEVLRRTLRNYAPAAVIHFAAFAYVGESIEDPAKYFQNNVANTIRLLEAMRAADIPRIVFSSSCAVYGIPEHMPISEDTPPRPVNPYGESKLFVERMLHWYSAAYAFSSVALRYFNAAGADPDCEIGEDHDPETHLIPRVIQVALGQRDAVEVFGTDYPTADGTAVRDYVHVSDLADAHVRALNYLLSGGPSTALNLGTGHGHSVRAIVRAVESVHRAPVKVQLAPRRPGDPPILVANGNRARTTLAWTPKFSNITEIVRTAYAWHARRLGVTDVGDNRKVSGAQ